MNVIPQSSATRTARMASWMSIERNSAPSDEAPKLRIGSSRSVFPSFLFFMFLSSSRQGRPRSPPRGPLHPDAHHQEQIREPLLIRGLDREHVVGGRHRLVELPFLD